MKEYVFSLCMYGIVSCVVQSLLPQGAMKKTAVFACSVLLITLFLEGGMTMLQKIRLPDWQHEAAQVQAYVPNDISARQIVQSILGSDVRCCVQYDTVGGVEQIQIISPQRIAMPNAEQSITDALCGIYDIEQEQIIFTQGR